MSKGPSFTRDLHETYVACDWSLDLTSEEIRNSMNPTKPIFRAQGSSILDANQFISTLDIRLAPSPAPSADRDSQNSTPMGSPALSGRWGPDVPLLPSALERQVKIKKGTDPLGLSVEMVDKGVNGMVVKSIQKQGAVHKDGTLHVGDYILSVNNETMKNITRSQARAILKRVDLLTSDIAVKYIPLDDAAIHMQTVMLTQQQGRESPVSAFVRQPSPSSPFIPTRLPESDAEDEYVTRSRFTPLASSSSYSLSSSIPTTAGTTPSLLTPSSLPPDLPSPFSDVSSPNSQRQFLDASMLDRPPVVPAPHSAAVVNVIKPEMDTTTNSQEDAKSPSFQEKRALFQAKTVVKPVIAAKPVMSRVISPLPKVGNPLGLRVLLTPSPPPLPPPMPKELEDLYSALDDASRETDAPTTPISTPSQPQVSPVQFGPERCVEVLREPNRGLGISIVWGQVDLSQGNHISGIFIKNVLPESPAGRSLTLKRGDRILEVDGKDLRDASHDKAVDVIKNADNPVKFLVQSLLPLPKDNEVETPESKEANKFAITPTLQISQPFAPQFAEKTVSPGQENLTKLTAPIDWGHARTPSPELIQRGVSDHAHLDTSHQGHVISSTGQVKGPMPDLVKERPGFTVTSFASAPEPVKQYSSDTEDSEEEVDERDLQGKVYTKKGAEIDRASAGFVKLSPSEREIDEEEDVFGYTLKKVQKKYAELKGELLMVELMKGSNGLGLSLAGNKDRTKMSVFICGMHPRGNAFKDGRLRVGDEVLEVNGVVLFGRCHLNASAMIKGLSGSSYKMILLRRDDALEDMAVKPITQFPVHLDDGAHGLGIMIIEGKHAEAGKGIFISDIQEVSPAAQAGLNVGDMILSVNQIDMTVADYDTGDFYTAGRPRAHAEVLLFLYKVAAQLLKQAEGLITLVVSSPGKVSLAPPASTDEDKSLASHGGGGPTQIDENSANGEKKTSPPAPPPKPAHLSVKSPTKMAHRSSSISSPQHHAVSSAVTRSSSVSASSKIPPTQIPSRVPTLEDASSTSPSSQDPTVAAGQLSNDHQTGNQLIQPPVTASDPKTSPIIPGQEVTIEITKEKMGLGLSIVGGSDTPLGTVIIHEVYPDGAAALDGRLRPGDQILEVNGEDLREAPHEAAITALRQTPSAVRMVVYREEGQNHEEDLYDVIEVALFKKQGRGLGLSIVGRKNGPGVYISEVVKGGVAEADGRLMQGDQILEVNEQDLKTATQEYAAAILKTTTGRITMKIGRLKAGSRRSVSGPKTNDIADVPLQYKTITLERGPDGLGFSIVGGCGSPHGDLPIYVKTVFEKGAAAENGLLQRGDQLVMVNDQSLEGVTHEEAVDILKNAKGTVTLTILS